MNVPVFVQFSDIVGHEQEAEVHFDLGFSEVAEPCESVVVFYLPEDRLWLELPSLEPRLVLGPVVIHPERSASHTSFISRSEMSGGLNGIILFVKLSFSFIYGYALSPVSKTL